MRRPCSQVSQPRYYQLEFVLVHRGGVGHLLRVGLRGFRVNARHGGRAGRGKRERWKINSDEIKLLLRITMISHQAHHSVIRCPQSSALGDVEALGREERMLDVSKLRRRDMWRHTGLSALMRSQSSVVASCLKLVYGAG